MTRIMNHSKWASDQSQIKLLIALDNPAPAPAPVLTRSWPLVQVEPS